jgi:hypothetical protein
LRIVKGIQHQASVALRWTILSSPELISYRSARFFMDTILPSDTPAAVILAAGQTCPVSEPVGPGRRSLLRLRGKICYWHEIDGKKSSWGVVKSDSKTKYHVHVSEILNSNAPEVGQRVEFSPRAARAPGELKQAVKVFVEREPRVN